MIRAPGIPGRGFWVSFMRTRIRPDPRSGVVVAITCMTRPFMPRLQSRTSRHHEARHTDTLRHSSATALARSAVTTFEPCRICSAIGRLYDDLHACAESWRCWSSPLDALPPSPVRGRRKSILADYYPLREGCHRCRIERPVMESPPCVR